MNEDLLALKTKGNTDKRVLRIWKKSQLRKQIENIFI
jgi:hypothetical protein